MELEKFLNILGIALLLTIIAYVILIGLIMYD